MQWIKALRIHQWLKNFLIFVPLLAAHEVTNVDALFDSLIAFAFFCLLASSVYILNDINDASEDRKHPTKKDRPFASESLSSASGYTLAFLLIIFSVGVAYFTTNVLFVVVQVVYLVISLVYTYSIRKYWIIDVIVLALLYTIRIIAGGVATEIELTFWILAFSMFIFFSLAMVKRYIELADMSENGKDDAIYGRGYLKSDIPMIASMGSGSGYLAVAVMALYINDLGTSQLYSNPEYIWAACPVMLYWVTRIWMLAHRGLVKHDPLLFAIKDKGSIFAGSMLLMIFWLAT